MSLERGAKSRERGNRMREAGIIVRNQKKDIYYQKEIFFHDNF